MNIINKFFLKLALLPSPFYHKMGVDVTKLKAIVTTKLIMDDRRPNSLQQSRRRKEKQVSLATVGTMIISALIGLVYLLTFSIGRDVVTQLTFYFTLFFFVLSLTLISDFTSVLIDVRDNYIILPKPVGDRTVVVARLLHILIHLCKIVLPMSLAGFCYMAATYNFYGSLLFLIIVLLTTTLSLFFINALYLLILKFTSSQRFQSIISYVQIVFAIVIYGSYQIFPRMVTYLKLDDFNIASKKAIVVYPIYWLANSWNVLFYFKGNFLHLLSGFAGFAFPFLCVYITIKFLAPAFNKKLALLNSSPGAVQKQNIQSGAMRTSHAGWLTKIFTGSSTEKADFLFTWKMTARSRDFKLKVYPSMGYMVVYVVVLFLNSRSLSLNDLQEESSRAKALILGAIYFTSFLLMMAIGQIIYSDKFKAAWIYYTSPVYKPGEVIAGATKAVILKFYVPIVFFIMAASLVLIGPRVLPNIIFGLFNEVLIAAILVYFSNKYFPFSVQQNTNVKTGGFLKGILILTISGFIGFGHYLIYSILPVVGICAALSLIASWLLIGSIKNISWAKINGNSTED